MSMSIRSLVRRRWLGLALAALPLIISALVVLADRTQAQTTPPPFPPCTGKKIDWQADCSEASPCAGSDPCSSWVEPIPTAMCVGQGAVAGDNCIPDKDHWKNCGTRGTCRRDLESGDCVQGFDYAVIQTNPVGDGGSCVIQ